MKIQFAKSSTKENISFITYGVLLYGVGVLINSPLEFMPIAETLNFISRGWWQSGYMAVLCLAIAFFLKNKKQVVSKWLGAFGVGVLFIPLFLFLTQFSPGEPNIWGQLCMWGGAYVIWFFSSCLVSEIMLGCYSRRSLQPG